MLARYIGDFAPTAAEVSVGGRVTISKNRELSNAVVYLTDSNGATRSARTNQFGYYRFNEVESGETYMLNVSSKRFTFVPQIVSVMDEINNLNFAAEE